MTLDNIAGLDLPPATRQSKLPGLLRSALQARGINGRSQPTPETLYWSPVYFGLDRVGIVQDASPAEQAEICAIAAQQILEEAYWIERMGVGYMARMVLLAETQEERLLYGLFAADETTHLAQIQAFLPDEPTHPDAPFLALLAELVASQDKSLLVFVLQVVLEGWGLNHYRNLAQHCQYLPLAQVFQGFLRDEARHHSTGVALFQQQDAIADLTAIEAVLTQFLSMIQVGPQGVLAAIEQVKGHLSRTQKITILEQLDTEAHSGQRLQHLRSLIGHSTPIMTCLEAQGLFQPLPAPHCI